MRFLLLTIVMMLIVAPAMGMGSQKQDFETLTPGGDLLGQTGWTGNGPWNVVANSALNGTQAIAPSGANDLWASYITPKPAFADGTIASSNALFGGNAGDYFAWNLYASYDAGNSPYAGLAWYDNSLLISDGGFGWYFDRSKQYYSLDMYANHNYALSAELDFTNQAVTYTISDITAGTSESFDYWFGAEATAAQASAGGFYLSGPGSMFDNLLITTVPEPSALVALGTGLMGMFGFAIRRRK